MRTRSSGGARRRPRAAWAALATGVVLCVVVVVAVLLPVLGLIGAADGSTAGALDVPVGAIVFSIVVGYAVGLAFLGLALLSRNAPLAWVFAVAAVVATLVGSVWPLFATAFASVDQARDAIPFIQDLIARVTG
ncbi:hypothetical protein [Rathayibacter tanaceti]|uniref:Uncharacterized protein n=2 Tax=Rathayibacter tanaceti TaxID=1671680 RepID=A0A162FVM9_9MICO|nr:hypothetical protein [Rathayibacter tanaceti]KZX20220.1 hypothetical protein ACH61_02673 [Rathayibacter tanaceti]QHC56797.1 hypothetical protein GSU10_14950 [Rathayibacter tanaceti]TCO33774.1 hypothetical protein EV639_11457 [Rathayibacter tanaceti]